MLPYFHPTTVALIDDDFGFTRSLADVLCQAMTVRQFTDPLVGLNHLVESDTDYVSGVARLSDYVQREGWEHDEPARRRGLVSSAIARVRDSAQRFQTTAVAVVDVNMPDIDGMMICKALRRRPVRAVLLTGNPSEELALAAFNDGSIDRFLSKHDPHFMTRITQHVRDLQTAYFRRITSTVRDALSGDSFAFMTDGAFLAHFDQVLQRERIAEYYVQTDPPAVELIRADGHTLRLLVCNRQTVQAQVADARAAGADEELVAALEGGHVIAAFPTEDGRYEPRFHETWRSHVWPAYAINATWLAAVLDTGRTAPEGAHDFVSFEAYRTSLMRDVHDHGP